MGFGMIGMILFWVLVVVGIVALVRGLGRPSSAPPPGRSAIELLRERYARGEIDRRAFEEMKRNLER